MALKGTLKDFSVADIFQLIGQQSKSGSLFVRTQEKEIQIVFDRGKVVLGTFRKSDEDFLLGTMLLRAGVISSEQLAQAMQQQQTTLRSLGDVLRSMGAITPATLGEFVTLQLKEVLFRLFQWKDGLYEFVPGEIKYNRTFIVPQSSEGVLMEGFRMLDEWPGILGKIETMEAVFRPLVDPSEIAESIPDEKLDDSFDDAFSFDDIPKPKVVSPTELDVTAEERKVFGLLDGHRPLQEVVYMSRLGTFETAKAAATLLDRHMVEKVDQLAQTLVAPTSLFKTRTGLGEWSLKSFRLLLAAFFLAFLLPFAAFGIRSSWSARFMNPQVKQIHETHLHLKDLRRELQRERIVTLLELHRVQTNTYPTALTDLLDPSVGSDWFYERREGAFILAYQPTSP